MECQSICDMIQSFVLPVCSYRYCRPSPHDRTKEERTAEQTGFKIKSIIIILNVSRGTSSIPSLVLLLTFYLSPLHAWASSTTTPSSPPIVVDVQKAELVYRARGGRPPRAAPMALATSRSHIQRDIAFLQHTWCTRFSHNRPGPTKMTHDRPSVMLPH